MEQHIDYALGRLKKLEEYRIHALDQVRLFNDALHKLEQSREAQSRSNKDLFERVANLEKENKVLNKYISDCDVARFNADGKLEERIKAKEVTKQNKPYMEKIFPCQKCGVTVLKVQYTQLIHDKSMKVYCGDCA